MTQHFCTIPTSQAQLQVLIANLQNRTVGSVARELNIQIPAIPTKTKGLVGQLVERYLGVANNNVASVDLAELGIELKTIPVNAALKPLESTYVCTVESNQRALTWQDSWVCKKLNKVLWVPILIKPQSPLGDNIILEPIMWQPSPEINAILEQDFRELMDLFYLGQASLLTAKYGTYLHIRPKAANSHMVVDYLDSNNVYTKIVPKGFYLRTQLTKQIMQLTCI
jgi:DNA mismatch repair protein MutH